MQGALSEWERRFLITSSFCSSQYSQVGGVLICAGHGLTLLRSKSYYARACVNAGGCGRSGWSREWMVQETRMAVISRLFDRR
jgi:hypothetical protein